MLHVSFDFNYLEKKDLPIRKKCYLWQLRTLNSTNTYTSMLSSSLSYLLSLLIPLPSSWNVFILYVDNIKQFEIKFLVHSKSIFIYNKTSSVTVLVVTKLIVILETKIAHLDDESF